jgi:hypothetical protein
LPEATTTMVLGAFFAVELEVSSLFEDDVSSLLLQALATTTRAAVAATTRRVREMRIG